MNRVRQRYMQALQSLDPNEAHILTFEQLQAILPHLSAEQVSDLLESWGSANLALPPVKVRGCIQTATFLSTSNQPYISNAGLFAHNKPQDFVFGLQAAEYAERVWPEAMTDISWLCTQKIVLCDPTKLNLMGVPTIVRQIYVTLTREWNELFNDYGQHQVTSWNNAIHFATTSRLEGHELQGGILRMFSQYNCAYCGGGLGLTACTGCGTQYADLPTGWNMPLAPKVVTLLEAEGHRFRLRPKRLY